MKIKYRKLKLSDAEKIRVWRNKQLKVLRQNKIIKKKDQFKYFKNYILTKNPKTDLFAIELNYKLIGYGGLVNISKDFKTAEVSFLVNDKTSIFDRSEYSPYCKKVKSIANKEFLNLQYSQLTGSGYVIESLESALWCFMKGDSFQECILLAANLGNDADTTAAICGQIAGAYYGFSNIPESWRSLISYGSDIEELALKLFNSRR